MVGCFMKFFTMEHWLKLQHDPDDRCALQAVTEYDEYFKSIINFLPNELRRFVEIYDPLHSNLHILVDIEYMH